MKTIFERLKGIALIIAGGMLYVGLNWIPILGPLLVGFLVGYHGVKSAKTAFNRGVLSGLLGSGIVALVLFKAGVFETSGSEVILTLMFAWVLFVWNVVGMLFCGLGGVAGVMAGGLNDVYNMLTGGYNQAKPHAGDVSYKICPKCGAGNLEKAFFCSACGSAMV